MGLDGSGKDIPNGYLGKEDGLVPAPSFGDFLESDRRKKSFAHRIPFKLSPAAGPVVDYVDKITSQVKAFNESDLVNPSKFLLKLVEGENKTHTLQVWEKGKVDQNGRSSDFNQLLEVDMDGSNIEIRTNNLELASDKLEDLNSELVSQNVRLIKLLVGADAISALNNKIKDVSNLQREAKLETKKTSSPKADKVDRDPNLKNYQKDIIPYNHPTDNSNADTVKEIVRITDHVPTNKKEIVRVTPHERTDQPPKPEEKKTFRAALVSAVQHGYDMTFRNAFGKEVTRHVTSKDVITQAGERFSRMKMTETANKRENEILPTVGNLFDRFWRGTLTKGIHAKKEKFHGIELMAAAGVETGITAEFDAEIDKRARDKITKERAAKKGGKFFGALRDFGNELIGRERDLHRAKVEITAKLRADYISNPSDDTNPIFALLTRDTAAREALAENVMDSPVDFLHAGDKKTKEFLVKKDSTFDKFLKEQVLIKIKDDVIDQVHNKSYNGRISAKTRVILDQTIQDYMFSDEFAEYRKSLSPEDQKLFENSFTYATNILSQAEANFVPLVHENLDQYKTWQAQDMDIWLTLGTAQLGPRGEIKAPSVFDKERISLNDGLFARLREKRRASKNHNAAGMYNDAESLAGDKRFTILKAMNEVANLEIFAAAAGALTGRALMTSARTAVSGLPIIGSTIFAGVAGINREIRTSTEMRGQWLVEAADGYEHPSGANAVRAEAMKRYDYYRMDMNVRVQQLRGVVEKLSVDKPAEEDILQTIAYLADSQARIRLGDKGGYSLFTASKDTGKGRGIFQAQETLHNKARSLAVGKLQALLDGEPNKALREKIAKEIGADPATATDTFKLVQLLAGGQERHLKTGTKVSSVFQAVMGKAENLLIDEERSIDAQDEKFNLYRWTQGVKHGAVSATFAGLFTAGAMHFKDLHLAIPKIGVEKAPVTVIDHDYPLHVVALPGNAGNVIDPKTSEVLDHTFTHIPTGTHWEADTTHSGAFDLVLEKDGIHKVLLNDATFSPDGTIHMNKELAEQITANHLSVGYVSHSAVDFAGEMQPGTTSTDIDTSSWTYKMAYKDFPGQDLDAHYAQTFHESIAAHPDMIPEGVSRDPVRYINAMRFLHRAVNNNVIGQANVHLVPNGYNRDINFGDSMYGSEYLVKAQPDNAFMDKLPSLIATQEGNAKYYKLVAESLQQGQSGHFTDIVHEVVYRTANEGTEDFIPDKVETNMILQYLGENTTSTSAPTIIDGGSITPHDILIGLKENLTMTGEVPPADVWNATIMNPAIAVIPTIFYDHPLEAIEPKPTSASVPQRPIPGPQDPQKSNKPKDTSGANESDESPKRQETGAVKDISEQEFKDFQGKIGAAVIAKMGEDPEMRAATIANPTSVGSTLAISGFMRSIADQHNLPLAYMVKNGRVQILTKPPENINANLNRVFVFNPETGREEGLEISQAKDSTESAQARLAHTIFFSNKSNFTKTTLPLPDQIADIATASGYLKDVAYGLSGYIRPEAKPFNPNGEAVWANDVIDSVAFAMAVKAAQSAIPPKSSSSSSETGGSTYIPEEIAPGFTPEQRRTKLEAIFPASVTTDTEKQAYLSHLNKTFGLRYFIEKERDILASETGGNWSASNKESNWPTSGETARIAGRYHIPMAFITTGMHAKVLTKPPQPVTGGYNITYYDPFKDGEQVQFVSRADSLKKESKIYYTQGGGVFPIEFSAADGDYSAAATKLTNYGYDLSLPTLPSDKAWLARAKQELLQEDGRNCTFWSIHHAAILWAMKPGHNEFKDNGAPIWEKELGFHLLTYEDVVDVPELGYSTEEFVNQLNTLIKNDAKGAADVANFLEPSQPEDMNKPEKLESLRQKYDEMSKLDQLGIDIVSSVLRTYNYPSKDLGEKLRKAREKFDRQKVENPAKNNELNDLMGEMLRGFEEIQKRLEDAKARGIREDETLEQFDARMAKSSTTPHVDKVIGRAAVEHLDRVEQELDEDNAKAGVPSKDSPAKKLLQTMRDRLRKATSG